MILWSLIRIIYISLIAHTGFLWPLIWNFFWSIFYILGVEFWYKTAAEGHPIMAWGTELEKWKPYERSQQILWLLINDIFHFMIAHSDSVIAHKDYLYQFDRSYRIFMTAHKEFLLVSFVYSVCWILVQKQQQRGLLIAWGTELEKWKPYERSQQMLWPLIRDIFHFMIAHRDSSDRS